MTYADQYDPKYGSIKIFADLCGSMCHQRHGVGIYSNHCGSMQIKQPLIFIYLYLTQTDRYHTLHRLATFCIDLYSTKLIHIDPQRSLLIGIWINTGNLIPKDPY